MSLASILPFLSLIKEKKPLASFFETCLNLLCIGLVRMCGIWLSLGQLLAIHKPKIWISTLSARGPEAMEIRTLSGDLTLGFTRLAINGLTPQGMQPFPIEILPGCTMERSTTGRIFAMRMAFNLSPLEVTAR